MCPHLWLGSFGGEGQPKWSHFQSAAEWTPGLQQHLNRCHQLHTALCLPRIIFVETWWYSPTGFGFSEAEAHCLASLELSTGDRPLWKIIFYVEDEEEDYDFAAYIVPKNEKA